MSCWPIYVHSFFDFQLIKTICVLFSLFLFISQFFSLSLSHTQTPPSPQTFTHIQHSNTHNHTHTTFPYMYLILEDILFTHNASRRKNLLITHYWNVLVLFASKGKINFPSFFILLTVPEMAFNSINPYPSTHPYTQVHTFLLTASTQ